MLRIVAMAGAILAMAGAAAAHETAGTWPHPHGEEGDARPVRLERYKALGGEFALTDTTGHPVRLSDLRGRVVLLFFGYTHCPDACPTTVANVTRALHALGEQRERVRFVFVTTDPERDTPARLREWLDGFDPAFVGLRGSAAELAAVEKRYGVFHTKLPPEAEPQGYPVNHTSRLFLLDRDGAVRYLFTPDQPAATIAAGVRLLLAPRSWWARALDWVTP